MAGLQLDAYFRSLMELKAESRQRYPQAIDASIQVNYGLHYGYGAWPPSEKKIKFNTRTSIILDDKPYGTPFVHEGPGACVGWIKTKDLSLGNHTFSLAMEYAIVHRGMVHYGALQSRRFDFEMIAALTQDDLIAQGDQALDRLVRDSFRMAETEEAFDPQPQGFSRMGPQMRADPWLPQITWKMLAGGASGSLHVPVWRLDKALPVDLCFAVELHDRTTGRVFPSPPVIVRRNTTRQGYFSPDRAHQFASGRSGLIPISIHLKPSRALALTSPEVTRYGSSDKNCNITWCYELWARVPHYTASFARKSAVLPQRAIWPQLLRHMLQI